MVFERVEETNHSTLQTQILHARIVWIHGGLNLCLTNTIHALNIAAKSISPARILPAFIRADIGDKLNKSPCPLAAFPGTTDYSYIIKLLWEYDKTRRNRSNS